MPNDRGDILRQTLAETASIPIELVEVTPIGDAWYVRVTGHLSGQSLVHARRRRITLQKIGAKFARQWSCEVRLDVSPDDAISRVEALVLANLRNTLTHRVMQLNLRVDSAGRVAVAVTFEGTIQKTYEQVRDAVAAVVKPLLDEHSIKRRKEWVNLLGDFTELPTKSLILRRVKVLQPVTARDLWLQIRDDDFAAVKLQWLEHQLDGLRLNRSIARAQSGHYSVTLDGLESLPPSRGRASSDVERLLAMRKRLT